MSEKELYYELRKAIECDEGGKIKSLNEEKISDIVLDYEWRNRAYDWDSIVVVNISAEIADDSGNILLKVHLRLSDEDADINDVRRYFLDF